MLMRQLYAVLIAVEHPIKGAPVVSQSFAAWQRSDERYASGLSVADSAFSGTDGSGQRLEDAGRTTSHRRCRQAGTRLAIQVRQAIRGPSVGSSARFPHAHLRWLVKGFFEQVALAASELRTKRNADEARRTSSAGPKVLHGALHECVPNSKS